MVQKLLMKVYCGCYSAPSGRLMSHFFQMSLVNMSTMFGYSRLILSGDISHFVAQWTNSFR
ncbi:hypothetical protein LDENG_00250070 [Lucifuga dentata]|nr:hypothetical protein LDENG_00250070 [Lucifuga dentata]